jgi:hypothetical protein
VTNGSRNGRRMVLCTGCCDTGLMELVMSDESREPWPCFYCEAGARIREAWADASSAVDAKDG